MLTVRLATTIDVARSKPVYAAPVAVPASLVEVQRREPWDADAFIELATIFDVSTDYLLGRESLDVVAAGEHENARPPKRPGVPFFVAGAGFEPTTSGL